MKQLDSLILTISQLPPAQRDREEIKVLKRKWAKEHSKDHVPSNIQVLKTYYRLVEQEKVKEDPEIERLLRKRSVRSMSGIVPIQVLTKPFWCPGKCIFCPTDATMPKSYVNTQPGAMRALLNQFDPYKQVYNRLLSLKLTGHATDKIEMIVLGGTRDVYPKSYKTKFVKGLYDACNTFGEFLQQVEIDYDNPKAARRTAEDLTIDYPETIEESIEINETTKQKIIGLTVETRPEYVDDENCQYWRSLGVTRIEMGIQTLHNDVHEANKRGHDNEAIRQAMHKLRQYGYKVSNHYMPGLYKSTLAKDLETFKLAYSSPWIKSDEQKFYPTAVIPNTGLYDLWKKGEYEPLDDDDLREIIRTVKTKIIPPYTRIKRLARDFDTREVAAGANTPNLRQLVMNNLKEEYCNDQQSRTAQYSRLAPHATECTSSDELVQAVGQPMEHTTETVTNLSGEDWEFDDRIESYLLGEFDIDDERNFVCLCTRCREMRQKEKGDVEEETTMPFLLVRRYRSSVGEELFISFEDKKGYLYGFARLLLPDAGKTVAYPGLGASTAIIRELHVYGKLQEVAQAVEESEHNSAQHKGFGTQLMEVAEQVSKVRGYKRLSVISGIGVRKYYEDHLDYEREGTYMVKSL